MLEIEVKFESPDNGKVEDALKSLGAERLSVVTMEDTYYCRRDVDFKQTDEALRLRRLVDGAAELTYKGPRIRASSAKAREELSISLDNALSARRILERLGFNELASVKKTRATYKLDALRIDVDDVEGLGQFVELEILTEDVSKAERLLEEMHKALPLGPEVKETYLEMLLQSGS